MFKVGDIIRIELFGGELTEQCFEIDQINENNFYKYRLKGLKIISHMFTQEMVLCLIKNIIEKKRYLS